MEDSGIVEFRRIHNQVQMVWRNIGYVAKPGTPEAPRSRPAIRRACSRARRC